MNRTRHVAIIGGGIGGLATAFFLGAEDGVEVTLFEREPSHSAHSSGRSAEILRTAIDDPVTEALALASATLLRNPATVGLHAPGELVDERGLYILPSLTQEAPWVQRHLKAGAAKETSLDELRKLAPHFAPQAERVLHLSSGGRIFGERLLASLARGALRRGVRIVRSAGDAVPRLEGARVVGVDSRGSHLPCSDLVVAAGAWSRGLGEAMGAPLPLRTTRRHMWVTPSDSEASPDAPIVWDDTAGFYVRPETNVHGHTGWAFSTTDLDEHPAERAAYTVSEDVRAKAMAAIRKHLPQVSPGRLRAWRGFRDLSPDDRPVIGADSRVEGLHWCAGLGGHGMTTSLAVGQATADAVLNRESIFVERCAIDRLLRA